VNRPRERDFSGETLYAENVYMEETAHCDHAARPCRCSRQGPWDFVSGGETCG
jgi:hypothetical protein